jgi:adenylate cyclase
MSQSEGENADGAPSAGQPGANEVRAELERILSSRCFQQAGRSSEFLRFVVEQSLAGAADRLKGYTIAIEVFNRPADFDAQADPLVRVEAGRLRRRLLEYYVAEGNANPLRIELPRGSYAPEAHYAPVADPVGEPAATTSALAAARRPRRWRRARTVGALATILALVGIIVLQQLQKSSDTSPEADDADATLDLPTGPKILVLPFENLSGEAQLEYIADGMTEEIMLRLSEFDLFVIASATSWSYRGTDRDPGSLAADVGARYILTGSVRNTPERVRIFARLVHASSGTQLWTAAYDEDMSVATMLQIQEKIAREVVQTIAVPYGPIYDQELARAARKPAAHLDTYDCVLKYYYYRRTFDPALHAQTAECFRNATVREPAFADAWAGLALLFVDEYAYGYTPQPSAAPPLDRAREAARTALDIDGENYLANVALAHVRFFSGDLEGFRRSADRVLELNANDADALALIGTLLTLSVSSPRASALVAKAVALSPRPPGLYYVAQSVGALRAGRADDALAAALRIDAPSWFIAPALVAASAGLAGRSDVAQRSATRLLELYPAFPQNAAAEIRKWQLDRDLGEILMRGLRAAGIQIPEAAAASR